jgi:hypothetical protein
MLQLMARAPLFSCEDLQHSSRGRGSAPPGYPRGLESRWIYSRYIRSTSACTAKLVAVSFFLQRSQS